MATMLVGRDEVTGQPGPSTKSVTEWAGNVHQKLPFCTVARSVVIPTLSGWLKLL
jgi:hypothetical protein